MSVLEREQHTSPKACTPVVNDTLMKRLCVHTIIQKTRRSQHTLKLKRVLEQNEFKDQYLDNQNDATVLLNKDSRRRVPLALSVYTNKPAESWAKQFDQHPQRYA